LKVYRVVRGTPTGEAQGAPATKSRSPLALLLAALVVLAAFVLLVPYTPSGLNGLDIFSQLANTLPGGSQTTTTQTSTSSVANPACSSVATDHNLVTPDINSGSASVAYPNDYCTIASYVLNLINQDRATNRSAPVVLDYNRAGQQHSDSMLYYSYFSHFDTQGLKPYMRYSMLGGLGADFENVAYLKYSSTHFTTTDSVEQAIKTLEESMVYNDSSCCNNGHRDNIFSPLHNKVSIGVAYNATTVYFDEEFENDYVNLSFTFSGASASVPYYVTMTGTPSSAPTPDSIYIAYDPTPSAETPAALNAGPHEYDVGTLMGGVLPKSGFPAQCGQFDTGITVCADAWTFTSTQMTIKFSMQNFVNAQGFGPGVYTIYLITGSSTSSAITTISVFVA
jgi:uncharacterized protein YkwD